jgi:chitinase
VATYGRGMFKTTVAAGPGNYQDLWWGGARENGWGMSITQRGSTLFAALFIYDATGKPMWVVMPGGSWNAGFTAYTGNLYLPSGSHFAAYDASRFNPGTPVGSATISFSSPGAATLAYTVGGLSGVKAIQRQSFGAPDATPVGTFADLWWGGEAQNGWGVSISQQYRALFAVWYTYDQAGRTTWFVVPGGTWVTANTWSGAAYRTVGSPWLGAAYDAAAFSPLPAGAITFAFGADAGSATMTYDVDGIRGTKVLVRQPL